MAPLTRFRASDKHVHGDLARDYYSQRASTPGSLLVTEATFISPRASGMSNVPGIWSDEQIAAWKKITDAVHEKQSFVFLQLWALGKRADPALLEKEEGGPYQVVSSSPVPIEPGAHIPRALTKEGIQVFIQDYANAAKNAIAAGFDGVEIHGANGYLLDQFFHEGWNTRTDEYGGSIENRTRFGIEVTKAVIDAVGDSNKVGIRLSPWANSGGEEQKTQKDPVPQFLHVVQELKKLDLAYLHLVESRVSGDVGSAVYLTNGQTLTRRNDPFINAWRGSTAPIILAGGFTPETASKAVEEVYRDMDVCVAFGRFYISTPDLAFRIKDGLPLTPYDRSTFYKVMSPDGFTDYPFSERYLASMATAGAA